MSELNARVLANPERFWASTERIHSCWEWRSTLNNRGYGRAWMLDLGGALAHRVAYELVKGPIPEGLVIDHLCRNKACVNPDHPEAVTSRENTLRGVSFSAINARRTACPRGHPYDYRDPRGWRQCRTCGRESARALRAKRRAAQIGEVEA